MPDLFYIFHSITSGFYLIHGSRSVAEILPIWRTKKSNYQSINQSINQSIKSRYELSALNCTESS